MTIGLWTGFFWRLNKSIQKRVKQKNIVMKVSDEVFSNTACSLVHALLSGIGSVYCLTSADLRADPIDSKSGFSVYLTRMSFGYLLYDFYDLMKCEKFVFRRHL